MPGLHPVQAGVGDESASLIGAAEAMRSQANAQAPPRAHALRIPWAESRPGYSVAIDKLKLKELRPPRHSHRCEPSPIQVRVQVKPLAEKGSTTFRI